MHVEQKKVNGIKNSLWNDNPMKAHDDDDDDDDVVELLNIFAKYKRAWWNFPFSLYTQYDGEKA